eukprot:4346752-Amphidinium_carterae.1
MRSQCMLSCCLADSPYAEDKDPSCPSWQAAGWCERNPYKMNEKCAKSCRICEQLMRGARPAPLRDALTRFGQIDGGRLPPEAASSVLFTFTGSPYMRCRSCHHPPESEDGCADVHLRCLSSCLSPYSFDDIVKASMLVPRHVRPLYCRRSRLSAQTVAVVRVDCMATVAGVS